MKKSVVLAAICLTAATTGQASGQAAIAHDAAMRDSVPNLVQIAGSTTSELAPVVNRLSADYRSITRRYDADDSAIQRRRMRDFYTSWQRRLREIDFDKLTQEGKVDYVLMNNEMKHELFLLGQRDKQIGETAELVPFAEKLLALQDTRRTLAGVNGQQAASILAQVTRQVDSLRALVEAGPAKPDTSAAGRAARPKPSMPKVSRTVANRAANDIDAIHRVTTNWYKYYDQYDPMFTWWTKDPYKKLDEAMTRYSRTIRERVVGFKAREGNPSANDGPIIGNPIGAEGLKGDLEYEMIPYTPQELISIAEREYAFSLSEMKKASREMGFGDNWKQAMEKVKNTYVEPGKQPELIRDLARSAEAYFDAHDYVTIPQLARED